MRTANTPICLVTRKAILPGDSVVLIPLRQQRTGQERELSYGNATWYQHGAWSHAMYHDAFWSPFSASLRATFMGAEGFEPRLSPARARHMDQLLHELHDRSPQAVGMLGQPDFSLRSFVSERLVEHFDKAKGELYAPEVPEVLLQDMHACWAHLWPAVMQQQLFIQGQARGECWPVAFAAMHRDAFGALYRHRSCAHAQDGSSMAPQRFFERVLEKAHQKAEARTGRRFGTDGITEYEFSSALWSGLEAVAGRTSLQFCFRNKRKVVRLYLAKTISAEALYDELKYWLMDAYVFSAMDLLGLTLSPVAFFDQGVGTGDTLAELLNVVEQELFLARTPK